MTGAPGACWPHAASRTAAQAIATDHRVAGIRSLPPNLLPRAPARPRRKVTPSRLTSKNWTRDDAQHLGERVGGCTYRLPRTRVSTLVARPNLYLIGAFGVAGGGVPKPRGPQPERLHLMPCSVHPLEPELIDLICAAERI